MTQAIRDLAKEALECLVEDKRPNGDSYLHFLSDCPEWMLKLAFAAHQDGTEGGMLPDDYRYQFIEESLTTITGFEGDSIDELRDEQFNFQADVYNIDLAKWLTSNTNRSSYVDEGMEDTRYPKEGLFHLLQLGQIAEKQEVFNNVLDFLIERASKEL